MAGLVAEVLKKTDSSGIIDLCSGSGGPMPEVLNILQTQYGMEDVHLTMTDLYPDLRAAEMYNNQSDNNISYLSTPVDATDISVQMNGIRTIIGGFHHMTPYEAKKILESAQNDREPICIFEISDNNPPIWLWWVSIPIIFVMTFFITPMVRPMSWQQLVFTYIIPIIPFCFAWDGAVSNARTYTLNDMDELLNQFQSNGYIWKKGSIEGMTNQLYLIGLPQHKGSD